MFLFFSISISELTHTRATRALQLVSERRVAAQVHAATISDLDEVWRAQAGRYMLGGSPKGLIFSEFHSEVISEAVSAIFWSAQPISSLCDSVQVRPIWAISGSSFGRRAGTGSKSRYRVEE